MDIITPIKPHTQPAELMEPTDRSLHYPAIDTQATAAGCSTLGQLRLDATGTQLLPLLLIIEAPVAHDAVRTLAGVAGLAGDRRDGVHQGGGLVGVGRVRRDRINDQRYTAAIGEHRVFAPGSRAIYGAGAGLFAPADGPDMAGVGDEPREVDLVGTTELGQEDLLDLAPDPGGLPVAQPVPAGHAATAAHLLGKFFPGEAGLEDEDDAGKDLAIVEEGSLALGMRRMRRKQWLDPSPEFIRE